MSNPYLPEIIEEIRSSPVYRRFLRLLRDHEIDSVYDCHAHISSGPDGVIEGAPEALVPQHPFSLRDVNHLYDELFRNEGIGFTSLIFDTPLPAYDLVDRNEQLLAECGEMSSGTPERVIPFAVITPEMGEDRIEAWVERGARGFKMTPRMASSSVRRGVISDIGLEEMLHPRALEIADREGLPLVVHLPQLVISPRMRQSLKDELVKIGLRYPGLKLILAHLGQAQTPAKMDDLLSLLEKNDLFGSVWMDISAVTIPSVIAMAMESPARLLFGTDIDFALVERGRYIMFRVINGKRVLAGDEENGNAITALVSQNFGSQLHAFARDEGIELDAPLLLFQLEGILGAVDRLRGRGRDKKELRGILRDMMSGNASQLIRR